MKVTLISSKLSSKKFENERNVNNMKDLIMKHPKTGVTIKIVDGKNRITIISDSDIDWKDESISNHYYTAKNHLAPYYFGIDRFQNGVSLVTWTLYPDGRYFEDEDGFGAENCNEENVYAYIDEDLKIVIPFQTMDDSKRKELYFKAIKQVEKHDY